MSPENRIRPWRHAGAATAALAVAALVASAHTPAVASSTSSSPSTTAAVATQTAVTTAAAAPTHTATRSTGQLHGRPGRLLRKEPLPTSLWLPGTARAYRLLYSSTGFDGRPTVVSGAMFVPPGKAPKRGWPVLSWAHGTLGVADVCANSTAGRSQRDIDYLTSWLAAGYAIVASDYEGLGTPGEHPYLHGRSEAYGVIDVVRAARRADRSLSRTWISSGQSQGGQAVLFAGAMQHKYAPELDYRGTIATAPPTQWRATVVAARAFDPVTPANPLAVLIISGLQAVKPSQVDPDRYLTAYGREVLQRSRTTACAQAVGQELAGRLTSEVFDVDAAEQEELIRLLERIADIPIKRHREPIFVAQGTADRVVLPPATGITADQLRAVGNDIVFKFYPGEDHNGAMGAAKPELLAWAAALIAKQN